MNLRFPKAVGGRAFTLIELLVVISIIGLLVAAGLPAIRGMNKSNAMIASNRQLQDDISYARQRAIADHTSVYIVFVPTNIINYSPTAAQAINDPALMTQYTNLLGGQLTTYALISMRLVGEQPGRATPHYLTPWRSLPAGVFFAQENFAQGPIPGHNPYDPSSPPAYLKVPTALPTATMFPYPNATNFPGIDLPYIGFNYLGQLIFADGTANGTPRNSDVYIPLARGSIFYARAATGSPIAGVADVQENPSGNSSSAPNVVHLSSVTGRARIETPALP